MITLAIDPGECTGLAWGFGTTLVAVAAAKPGDALDYPPALPRNGGKCIIEIPRYYGSKAYGHPAKATAVANALIREAITLGGWACAARALGFKVSEEFPRTWKGTVNKRAMCRRIIKCMTLTERQMVAASIKAQKIPKSKVHNVLDAIGIFFWSVGRL